MESNTPQKKGKKILTLAIKESQVSVTPDGKEIVHIAIINNGTENDQVKLTVKGIPEEWVKIERSTIYIAAGAIIQVNIIIQPPPYPQSDVGEFIMEVHAVSHYDPWRWDTVKCSVVVVAYESKGRIGVLLGSVNFSIMPDTNITIPMIMKNHGIKDDVFILGIEGIPGNWITTSSLLTRVNAGQKKQTEFDIRVPRSSKMPAGRTPFKIIITSQNYAVEKVEVDCILTVAAFTQFSGVLEPENLQSNEPGSLTVKNEGNTVGNYNLTFHCSDDLLVFEKISRIPKKQPTPNNPRPELETVYTEIVHPEKMNIPVGQSAVFEFRCRPRAREFIGDEKIHSYTARIQSSSRDVAALHGQVSSKGMMPKWAVTVAILAILVLCFLVIYPGGGIRESASATQTAAVNQTQAVISGLEDPDMDGLINDEEAQIGTNPLNPDTEGDGLGDGEEVKTYGTNPLVPDTDSDLLGDAEEIHQYGTDPLNADTDIDQLIDGDEIKRKTDPLNPDTDGDLLNDGDEVNRKTDPLNPDTDQDALNDGAEVSIGTDPLKPDTDKDQLLDGQENQNCPHPLNPDTDEDGIIDGRDLDPCDPNNPSLTATANAGNPPLVPTDTPWPIEPFPTETPEGQPTQPGDETPVHLPEQETGQPRTIPSDICGSVSTVGLVGLLGIVLVFKKREQGM